VKLLVDMSLTPEWVSFLSGKGIEAEHWSEVGNPKAPDHEIMAFARERGYVVFTHDLYFGHLLAATNARGPSVIQVRTQNPTSVAVGDLVVSALRDLEKQIQRGALVTIEPSTMRSRILPLFPSAG
jgi:predicted nuclease of predicted toxin-antitoxin system